MTLEEMKEKLKNALSHKRFVHSVNVMNVAVQLAQRYSFDTGKASEAGLLHDCARDIRGEDAFKLCEKYRIEIGIIGRRQPELLHGPLGSKVAMMEYGITDTDILEAIHWHTTGCDNMSLLAKIIYIADYIEPGRNFPGVDEVRHLAFNDIDRAMIVALDRTIKYVMIKGALIHPDTVNARNSILMQNPKADG